MATPESASPALTQMVSVDLFFRPWNRRAETGVSIAIQTGRCRLRRWHFHFLNGTHRLGSLACSMMDVDRAFSIPLQPIRRLHAGAPATPPESFCLFVNSDGNVLIGAVFLQVGGGQADANIRFDPSYPTNVLCQRMVREETRHWLRNRSNVAALIGGSTAGPAILVCYSILTLLAKTNPLSRLSLTRDNGTLVTSPPILRSSPV